MVRTLTMDSHEIQALAGYLEGGGLKTSNLRTLEEVDLITRGGRDLFFWGLDANVPPEAWNELIVGERTWLDRMGAELLTVQKSDFNMPRQTGQHRGV